jgi:non-specific serine/threonine protein kinase/serine/threonine-protein kinase
MGRFEEGVEHARITAGIGLRASAGDGSIPFHLDRLSIGKIVLASRGRHRHGCGGTSVTDEEVRSKGSRDVARPRSATTGGGAPGVEIPNFRIGRRLGEGGMGAVYEALQEKPVRRKVAIKLIKPGMDSTEVVARFESERQALAMMSHTYIARVFDGGVTAAGRPYFVMEYVEGIPITDYCNEHELDTRARLELFIDVCEGVQHAHQKGILHRDLKPTNVLVNRQGDKHVPKIIDFGLAKAVATPLTAESAALTQVGEPLGTPEYMSPEQFDLGTVDIDTRTDVYSLGVLLYEMLAGERPFRFDDVPGTAPGLVFLEFRRRVRDVDAPRPSTRVSRLAASERRMDITALTKRLRGDLDWIVMKALEKDRTRRYASASEFAADVARHLNDEPVLASPPSTAYRLQKFVRRHRVGVAAGIVVALALGTGIAGTTIALFRAIRAEARATAEANRANLEAETAKQVSDFMVGLFEVVDPGEARGNSITAREILDNGARKIEVELAEQPEVQATLMDTMGVVYKGLGLYDAAVPLLENAVRQRRAVLGKEDLLLARSMNHLGEVLHLKADYPGAEPIFREALELRRTILGEEHPAVAESLDNLALLLSETGKQDEAEPMFREALEMRRRLLGDHPDVAESLNNLAFNIYRFGEGDAEAAETFLREALEIRTRLLGDHPDTAESLNNLAFVLYKTGDREGAEPLFREALEMKRRLFGEIHPELAMALNNLAFMLHDQGKLDEAEEMYRETLAIHRELLGNDHPNVAMGLDNLAVLMRDKGEFETAAELSGQSLAIYRKTLEDDHPTVKQGTINFLVLSSEAVNDQRRRFGEDDPRLAKGLVRLAELLLTNARYQDALENASEARDIYAKTDPDDVSSIALAEGVSGAALVGLERFDEAEKPILESMEKLEASEGENTDLTLAAIARVVDLYTAWGKPERADSYRHLLESRRQISE